MAFYAEIENGYIISIAKTDNSDTGNISAERYNEIKNVIESKQAAPAGYDYILNADTLDWELMELPVYETPSGYTEAELLAMTNSELEIILAGMGISVNMTKANMVTLILAMQEGDAL